MPVQSISEQLQDWSFRFRAGDMTVDDVQESFAVLSEEEVQTLSPQLREAVVSARQELDAIRFGMCEAGQAGEIRRIFAILDAITRPS